ncbi:MAG: ANTAR domain-containing protein, partial [Acidimicrobiia bacterium]
TVVVSSMAEDARFPTFGPRALGRGVHSMISTPLAARDRPVGALNIYSRTAGAFADEEDQLIRLLAGGAAGVVARARERGPDTEDLARRLRDGLERRETIALAQGILMARDAVSADEAFTVLRRFSQLHSTPLRDCAEETIVSTGTRLPPAPVGTSSPPALLPQTSAASDE